MKDITAKHSRRVTKGNRRPLPRQIHSTVLKMCNQNSMKKKSHGLKDLFVSDSLEKEENYL